MDEIVRSLQCLELSPGSSQEEVRKAYRELAMVWHPDRFPADSPLRGKADEKLKEINQAYDFLMKHGFVDGLPVIPSVPADETAPPAEPPIEPEAVPETPPRNRFWLWGMVIALILGAGIFTWQWLESKSKQRMASIRSRIRQKQTTPAASNPSLAQTAQPAPGLAPSNTPTLEPVSIMPMHALGCTPTRLPDGTLVFEEGEMATDQEYSPPFTLRVVAQTDLTNIRLHFAGRGWVVFNWEVNPSELRYLDPRDGHVTPVPGQGKVEPNVWQDIQWVVETNGSSVFVNGQKRAAFTGNYLGLSDLLGIGVCNGSKLLLRHFSVQTRGQPENPPPPNLSSGLVLHFSFDDLRSGGVVPDLSPCHNDGHALGVNPVLEGKLGGAFDFRGGVSNYVMVRHSSSLVAMQKTRQMTMAVWLKPRSLIGVFPVVLDKGGSFPPRITSGYELLLHAENDLHFSSGSYGLWTARARGRWIGKHLGEWIHVALVINAQNGLRKFYVNGQRTGDEQEFNAPDPSQINFSWPGALFIGVPVPGNHPNRGRYDGLMDDLRLYSRALTSEEIRQLAGLAENH